MIATRNLLCLLPQKVNDEMVGKFVSRVDIEIEVKSLSALRDLPSLPSREGKFSLVLEEQTSNMAKSLKNAIVPKSSEY